MEEGVETEWFIYNAINIYNIEKIIEIICDVFNVYDFVYRKLI